MGTGLRLKGLGFGAVPRKSIFLQGLHAAWALNGNFLNGYGPLENLTEESAWEEQLGTGSGSGVYAHVGSGMGLG